LVNKRREKGGSNMTKECYNAPVNEMALAMLQTSESLASNHCLGDLPAMPNGSTPTYEFVYAIQAVNLKTIKIGFSTDVSQRLRALQTGSPDELKIIGCWLGTQDEEGKIHSKMAQWLVHGEWFLPAADLIELIAKRNQAKPTDTPGLLRLTTKKGHEIEIWESARAEKREKNCAPDPFVAILNVFSKAEMLSRSLPLEYGQIAEQIAINANIVFRAMQNGTNFKAPSPKQQGKLMCSFCDKKSKDVKKLVAGPNVYICNECIAICNVILDEKEDRSRHVYLIEIGGKGYWWAAESKEEAIRAWIRQYGFSPNEATAIRVTLKDDKGTLRIWSGPPYDDTNPPTAKTHREWAEEREGLIGALITESPQPSESVPPQPEKASPEIVAPMRNERTGPLLTIWRKIFLW
jgi:hypothetical protein